MDIQLRPWRITDLPSLVRHANNPNIARQLTNQFPSPYTEVHANAFIEMATSHDPVRIMAIVINGEACGGIGIHPQSDVYCKNAELGYWLSESYWGKGIVSQLIPKMIHHGFENFPIDRIYARPYGRNIASQKVLEKSGFKLEAKMEKTFYKNGEYLDELIYAIRRSDV